MKTPGKTLMPSPAWLRHLTQSSGWRLAMGLSSGTSADGIDTALLEVRGEGSHFALRLKAHETFPYPGELRRTLLRLAAGGTARAGLLARLDFALGEYFARAALSLLKRLKCDAREVTFVGSHGQTLSHLPRRRRFFGVETAATWQLGSLSVIAERTGITTVGNFRMRDVAAGGEGAPLLPYVDWLLFRSPLSGRALLNVGGIANVTFLPRGGDENQVVAFDVGPGNMLIDGLVALLTEGKRTMDFDGAMASQGKVARDLIEECMQHPFFRRPPPRSTGREEFGASYVRHFREAAEKRGLRPEDMVATATALTAHAVRRSLEEWAPAQGEGSESLTERFPKLYLSGGGLENPVLSEMIRELARPVVVCPFDELGIPSRAREAVSFAVLANECLARRHANLPRVTGAERRTILGEIAWGSGR